MASTEQERYILHLNHALAMESALIDHLERRSHEVTMQEVRTRILQHRDETVRHRDTVREIIESLGGEPTSTKANIQSPVTPGMLGKVLTALESEKEDRMLLESMADYSVENYEAGLYQALAQIAHNLGFEGHVSRFNSIRQQEVSMAEFISQATPQAINMAFPSERKAA